MEAVWRSPWLESATAIDVRTIRSYFFGDPQRLFFGFDSAGAGHDDNILAADHDVANPNFRVVLLEFPADQFVRMCDLNQFNDARHVFKKAWLDGPWISGETDGGAARAGHRMWLKP